MKRIDRRKEGGNMKVLTNTVTHEVRIVGQYGTTVRFPTRQGALRDYERIRRNAEKRGTNQMLRDLTGTSAAAARRDMGL